MSHDDDPHLRHLTVLTHDLRGRLGAALMSVDLLRRQLSDAPAEVREDVTSLRMSLLDSLFRLTQLATLERLRLGGLAARPAPVDLADLATALGARYAEPAAAAGMRLSVTGAGRVVVDRFVLEHLAANLLDNAIRHSRGSAVVCRWTGGASGWSLEVEDDGVGLSAAAVSTLRSAELPGCHPDGPVGLRLVRLLVRLMGDGTGAVTLLEPHEVVGGPRLGGRGTRIRVDSSPSPPTTDNRG